MLNTYGRAFAAWLFTPVAAQLLRLGVSPDAVTVTGTVGVCAGALLLFPAGQLFAGVIVIGVFVLSDSIDGIMARRQGRSAVWGAYLDSTLDRVADAAIFGGLVLYFTGAGAHRPTAVLALLCLVLAFLVSYARARAEGLGMSGKGGPAERAERLVVVLVATGLVGLGLPVGWLAVALAGLAVASAVTVAQRMRGVLQQSRALGRT
ncbi:MAG: CDP-alcohol phosphatidyltransferase [Micrococcales bacterium]|nr:MAG: CDP-alcohol phosphatidyltransferase [Micrococcales bacterium]PIE27233.1 MAG: CDP-alcohol phosphatidyltransferase [Micrococcales bacterium]